MLSSLHSGWTKATGPFPESKRACSRCRPLCLLHGLRFVLTRMSRSALSPLSRFCHSASLQQNA